LLEATIFLPFWRVSGLAESNLTSVHVSWLDYSWIESSLSLADGLAQANEVWPVVCFQVLHFMQANWEWLSTSCLSLV